jgi:hypothetical protein
LEEPEAGTADALVWIDHRDHDAADAGIDQRLGARRIPVLMRAGLEVHIESRTASTLAGGSQGFLFGVRVAGLLVVSLARQPAFGVDQDRANHRVGARPVVSLAREVDGVRGPVQVNVLLTVCLMQSWQYTRAEGDHCAVINNRKRSTRISSCL